MGLSNLHRHLYFQFAHDVMAAMLRWCVGGQEQKYFSPLGTKHYFHANSSEKFYCIDHRHTTNMAALYAWVFLACNHVRVEIQTKGIKTSLLHSMTIWVKHFSMITHKPYWYARHYDTAAICSIEDPTENCLEMKIIYLFAR